MIYLTHYRFSADASGNHGHRLMDLIGAIVIAKVFGFTYVHTYNEYLEFFSIGNGELNVDQLDPKIEKCIVRGQFWAGLTFEQSCKIFNPIKDKYKNKDCLIETQGAVRIHPSQTVQWFKDGLIKNDIFEEIVKDINNKFIKKHRERQHDKSDGMMNVAIHINRGIDYDKPMKKVDGQLRIEYVDHTAPRYFFPMSYFENIILNLQSVMKNRKMSIKIYTEIHNSEEIVEVFSERENIEVCLGKDKGKGHPAGIKDQSYVHDIFYNFISSDILVACNSSFSSVGAYFRWNKTTIYHPYSYMNNLPETFYFPTDEFGNFNSLNLSKTVKL